MKSQKYFVQESKQKCTPPSVKWEQGLETCVYSPTSTKILAKENNEGKTEPPRETYPPGEKREEQEKGIPMAN